MNPLIKQSYWYVYISIDIMHVLCGFVIHNRNVNFGTPFMENYIHVWQAGSREHNHDLRVWHRSTNAIRPTITVKCCPFAVFMHATFPLTQYTVSAPIYRRPTKTF